MQGGAESIHGLSNSEMANPSRRKNLVKRTLYSVPILGVVLFVFSTTFPPIDELTELNLAAHMFQHVLIAISGILIAYPLYRAGKFDRIKGTKGGILGFIAVTSLLVAWHIPVLWNAAVQDYLLHFLEHLSFLTSGILIGSAILMLSDNFKLFIVALAISAHDIYGFTLYLTTVSIYPPSPIDQQSLLGIALFGPSPIYIIAYLIFTLSRENKKIEEREASKHLTQIPLQRKGWRKVPPALTISMLIILGIYFTMTSAILFVSSRSGESIGGSTIYIVESPVLWQYSPQNIRVVVGINNTVVWISYSYTSDTVTSDDGSFNSPLISPGGTWTWTFSLPGTYSYHCQFHPWMKGNVIVMAA